MTEPFQVVRGYFATFARVTSMLLYPTWLNAVWQVDDDPIVGNTYRLSNLLEWVSR